MIFILFFDPAAPAIPLHHFYFGNDSWRLCYLCCQTFEFFKAERQHQYPLKIISFIDIEPFGAAGAVLSMFLSGFNAPNVCQTVGCVVVWPPEIASGEEFWPSRPRVTLPYLEVRFVSIKKRLTELQAHVRTYT